MHCQKRCMRLYGGFSVVLYVNISYICRKDACLQPFYFQKRSIRTAPVFSGVGTGMSLAFKGEVHVNSPCIYREAHVNSSCIWKRGTYEQSLYSQEQYTWTVHGIIREVYVCHTSIYMWTIPVITREVHLNHCSIYRRGLCKQSLYWHDRFMRTTPFICRRC